MAGKWAMISLTVILIQKHYFITAQSYAMRK